MIARRVLSGLGLGLFVLGSAVAPARAQEPDTEIRRAVLVDVDDRALEEGGSATPFTLRLSGEAECQGDSRDAGYRVNSYLVSGDVSPFDVVYDGLGPSPWALGDHATFQHPLFDVETTSFASVQTQNAEEEGGIGKLQPLPGFDLDVFLPGQIPQGRYHLGITCTLLNEITRVWDAEIDVTTDPSDEPAQIHWTVVGFEPDADSSSSPVVPLVAAALVVGVIAIVFVRRRSRSADPTPHRRST